MHTIMIHDGESLPLFVMNLYNFILEKNAVCFKEREILLIYFVKFYLKKCLKYDCRFSRSHIHMSSGMFSPLAALTTNVLFSSL